MLRSFTISVLAIHLCLASFDISQTTGLTEYEVRGIIRDQKGQVFPGLRLQFKSDKVAVSRYIDLNGEFNVRLPDGDFVLTIESMNPDADRLFIKLGENEVKPGYLEFVVDWTGNRCGSSNSSSLPTIVKSSQPTYPAAANAVRAGGEVSVVAKIRSDGSVLSGKALSGHPLLRRAAEIAVEKFIFEANNGGGEREAQITFVFLSDQEEKPNVVRLTCAYRPIVIAKSETLQTG